HDVVPSRQRPLRKALPRLASHHHRLAHGRGLEPLHIGGQPPGKVTVPSDDAIFGDRNDERYFHGHRPSVRFRIRMSMSRSGKKSVAVISKVVGPTLRTPLPQNEIRFSGAPLSTVSLNSCIAPDQLAPVVST